MNKLIILASLVVSLNATAGKERGGGDLNICFDSPEIRKTVADRIDANAWVISENNLTNPLREYEKNIVSTEFWDLYQVKYNSNYSFPTPEGDGLNYLYDLIDRWAEKVPSYQYIKDRIKELQRTKIGFFDGVVEVNDTIVRGINSSNCLRIQLGYNEILNDWRVLLTENTFLVNHVMNSRDLVAYYLHEGLYSLYLEENIKEIRNGSFDPMHVQIAVRDLLNTKTEKTTEELLSIYSRFFEKYEGNLSRLKKINILDQEISAYASNNPHREEYIGLLTFPQIPGFTWSKKPSSVLFKKKSKFLRLKSSSNQLGTVKGIAVSELNVMKADGKYYVGEFTTPEKEVEIGGVVCTARKNIFSQDIKLYPNGRLKSCHQKQSVEPMCDEGQVEFYQSGKVKICADPHGKVSTDFLRYSEQGELLEKIEKNNFVGSSSRINYSTSSGFVCQSSDLIARRPNGSLKFCSSNSKPSIKDYYFKGETFKVRPELLKNQEGKEGVFFNEEGNMINTLYMDRNWKSSFCSKNHPIEYDFQREVVSCFPPNFYKQFPLDTTKRNRLALYDSEEVLKMKLKASGEIKHRKNKYPYFVHKGSKFYAGDLSLYKKGYRGLFLLEGDLSPSCKAYFYIKDGKRIKRRGKLKDYFYTRRQIQNRKCD